MSADTPLPTVIVIHPKERRSKCSVEPLRGRDGFEFVKFPAPVERSLDHYVRLGLGGPELSCADASCGLLLLDGTWKLAGRMERDYRHVPVRTLPSIKTAYPRTSKVFDDPAAGLATIEALYAALKIMGRDIKGLLDQYHWAEAFLTANNWDT